MLLRSLGRQERPVQSMGGQRPRVLRGIKTWKNMVFPMVFQWKWYEHLEKPGFSNGFSMKMIWKPGKTWFFQWFLNEIDWETWKNMVFPTFLHPCIRKAIEKQCYPILFNQRSMQISKADPEAFSVNFHIKWTHKSRKKEPGRPRGIFHQFHY